MPSLTDPVILGQFRAVLANWRYTGYVTAKDVVLDWIANELGGLKLKDVAKAMHDFLQGGGVIDQIPETRSYSGRSASKLSLSSLPVVRISSMS